MTSRTPAGLRGRIIHAAGWVLGAHGAELAIRLVSNLIMTRLLFPEAFGLMAVVMSIPVGLALITDAGIAGAIVRSKNGEDDDFLRSAWTLQVIRGFVIWLMVLAVAAVLSIGVVHQWLPEQSTVADPLMPTLLAVVGVGVALQGLESVNLHVSVRRVEFKRLVLIGIGGKLVALPIMLLWAMHDRSVWALVAGMMAAWLCQLVLSHTLIPGPRMAFRWHPAHVREMFHFGKWITLASAATFITVHSELLILGALFPGAVLGLYAIARLLVDAFQGVFQRLHGSLTLPVLAEVLRQDPDTLRHKYYRFRLPIEAAAFLSGGALLTAGPGIVELLYDDRYIEAGWMLQILSLSVIAVPFQLIGNAFIATGETRVVAVISALQAVSLVIFLFLGYQMAGLVGAIWGIALVRVPATILIITLAQRRNWISVWGELRCVPLIAVGALIGALGLMVIAL